MKIAFHIHSLTKGGAERAVSNLANKFSELGHEVFVITSIRSGSEYMLNKEINRIVLYEGEGKTSYFFRYGLLTGRLRQVCKKYKFDVIIPFISGSSFRAMMATCGMKTKVIASVRNDPNYEYSGKIGAFIGKKVLPLIDGCVFQTEDAKAWFPSKLQKKSIVIKNAINPLFFTAKRNPVKNRIVTFGRLAYQKNQALLIDVFYDVSKEIEDAELYIFGKGECYQELSSKILDLDLTEKVHLMGETSKVLEELEKADIFVLSSNFEGMPNALMEAMAAGVPCISTDCPCGGPSSLINDGTNGFLVSVNDISGMSQAIKTLLNDDRLKKQIGEQASIDSRMLTPKIISEEWLKYIGEVIISN